MPTRYTIAVTEPARDDLITIHERLVETASFPQYPEKVRNELLAAIRSLALLPERGSPRRNGVRLLMTRSHHNIVYRVVGENVEVLRIRHQRQRRAARP